MLLKDISPLHAAIIAGEYDEHLESLRQAVNHRIKIATRKSGLVPNAIVRVVDDPRASHLAGQLATVVKVNQKSVSIDLLDESIPEWKRGYRVSPGLLEVQRDTPKTPHHDTRLRPGSRASADRLVKTPPPGKDRS